MNKSRLVIMVLALAASNSTEAKLLDGGTSYVPPTASLEINNSRNLSASYDKTWKAVVAHLSETSFVIDNIDKDSGLISVSFSVSDPRTAIDCGQWSTWVKNLRGRRDYQFNGAAPYAQYEILDNGTLANVERNFSLSGKFNILVTSSTEQASRIKVTTRYVPSLLLKIAPLKLDMNFVRVAPRVSTDSFNFNTGQQAQIPGGETVCRSKGSLEAEILDGASRLLE